MEHPGPLIELPKGTYTVSALRDSPQGMSGPVQLTIGVPAPPDVVNIIHPTSQGADGCFTINNYDFTLLYTLTDIVSGADVSVTGEKVSLPIGNYEITATNSEGTSDPTPVVIFDVRPPSPILGTVTHPMSPSLLGSVPVTNHKPGDTYTATNVNTGTEYPGLGSPLEVPNGSYTVVAVTLSGGVPAPTPLTIGRPAPPVVDNFVHPTGPGDIGCFTIVRYDTGLTYTLVNSVTGLQGPTINEAKVSLPIGEYSITATNSAGPSLRTPVVIYDDRPPPPVLGPVTQPMGPTGEGTVTVRSHVPGDTGTMYTVTDVDTGMETQVPGPVITVRSGTYTVSVVTPAGVSAPVPFTVEFHPLLR